MYVYTTVSEMLTVIFLQIFDESVQIMSHMSFFLPVIMAVQTVPGFVRDSH